MTNSQHAIQQRHRRPMQPTTLYTLAVLLLVSCLSQLPTTSAFAAWFVDRQVSCFTDLAANEIIMNNEVLPYSKSHEPMIRLEVSPLGNDDNAEPNSQYAVKFIVPESAKSRVPAVFQYILELHLHANGISSGANPPAKFTTAPPHGGIGCDGKRSHGKALSVDSATIVTINADAARGARLEIVAGWATGHAAVTLTEKVVLVVGEGAQEAYEMDDHIGEIHEEDDHIDDDEAEADMEEDELEEEWEELQNKIDSAEKDAVEALEEKRQQTDGDKSGINEVEEEIVETLEANLEDVNQAIHSLKDDITSKQAEIQEKRKIKHKHSEAHRRDAQLKHREHHERKHMIAEDKLAEMHRRFEKKIDSRTEKLDKLMDMKDTLTDSVKKLQAMDKKEHDKAKREHIKPLPKAELKVDMEELKQKAREKLHTLTDKLNVKDMMKNGRVKDMMKNGRVRGGAAAYHGDVGKPLRPEVRYFLVVVFSLLGLLCLGKWFLDRRRRAQKKGRKFV